MDYYNEHDPFAAAWLRELIKAGEIPDGHVDERDIQDVHPSDLVGYRHCHFFAGIGGWALCPAPRRLARRSAYLDRKHAPANLSARQAKALGLLTSGTCGPPSSGSSASASLATSVANRLRQAMRFDGGILWRLTWKGRATPARRWIYQRQASARRTSGADCSGWPTPNTLDTIDREGLRPSRIATNRDSGYLTEIVVRVPWPTPVTTDAVGAGGRNETAQKDGSKTHAGTSLTDAAMAATGWTTPSARDWKDSAGMAQTGTNPDGTERMRLDQLPRQAALTAWAGWGTPRVTGNGNHGNPSRATDRRARLEDQVHGTTLSGSPAPTGKRGQLNPAFSLWLMGYPTAWARCAARVMPSSRKRRLKS
jgi:hypothetical protein